MLSTHSRFDSSTGGDAAGVKLRVGLGVGVNGEIGELGEEAGGERMVGGADKGDWDVSGKGKPVCSVAH